MRFSFTTQPNWKNIKLHSRFRLFLFHFNQALKMHENFEATKQKSKNLRIFKWFSLIPLVIFKYFIIGSSLDHQNCHKRFLNICYHRIH